MLNRKSWFWLLRDIKLAANCSVSFHYKVHAAVKDLQLWSQTFVCMPLREGQWQNLDRNLFLQVTKIHLFVLPDLSNHFPLSKSQAWGTFQKALVGWDALRSYIKAAWCSQQTQSKVTFVELFLSCVKHCSTPGFDGAISVLKCSSCESEFRNVVIIPMGRIYIHG